MKKINNNVVAVKDVDAYLSIYFAFQKGKIETVDVALAMFNDSVDDPVRVATYWKYGASEEQLNRYKNYPASRDRFAEWARAMQPYMENHGQVQEYMRRDELWSENHREKYGRCKHGHVAVSSIRNCETVAGRRGY